MQLNRQTLLVERFPADGYALITLNRPDKRNALNRELLESWLQALDELRFDDEIGVIVTTGAGNKAYCSGMDLNYLKDHSSASRAWSQPSLLLQVMEALRLHPKITLAMVRGYCLGGGLALVLAHELAVAASTAQFGMPEIIRGSFGQLATGALFHAGLSTKAAFRLQLTGRNVAGPEAQRLGIVSDVVPDGQLEPYTFDLAREIAGHNHAALEHAKIAAYLGQEIEYGKALRLDNLVGSRLRLFTDPFANLPDYLQSQKGGTDPGYGRPE